MGASASTANGGTDGPQAADVKTSAQLLDEKLGSIPPPANSIRCMGPALMIYLLPKQIDAINVPSELEISPRYMSPHCG